MPQDAWALIGALCSVFLILFLAYLFTKYVVGRSPWRIPACKHPSGELCVLSRLSLGRAEQLVLVKLHTRCLLLAVTSAGVCLVTELSQEEADPWLRRDDSAAPPPRFLEILQNSVQKKK